MEEKFNITENNYEYAGFWIRFCASIIDTIVLCIIITPVLYMMYGSAYFGDELSSLLPGRILVEWIFPIAASVGFWVYKSATPGKMALSLKVLDEKTGAPITVHQSIVRYLGYFVSAVTFLFGFIWVGMDSKKQGFHDKMASTVVVRDKNGGVKPVEFSN